MRTAAACLALLLPIALASCGSTTTERTQTERTVVVSPQPGQTVVVPPEGQPSVCPSNDPTCQPAY